MNPRKNKTTGFVPSYRPPVPSHNQKQIESCVSSECLLRNTKAERKKPMEPADIIRIDMSTKQADEILYGNRETIEFRKIAMEFASQILAYKPTPAQAQATLVLAWNEMLLQSKLISRKTC